MRVVLFYFVLCFVCGICSAEDYYLDFETSSMFFSNHSPLEIKIIYQLENAKETDFILLPNVSSGLVEWYQADNKTWFSSNQTVIRPKLSSIFTIKLTNVTQKNTQLCLNTQDLKSTRIFNSTCKNLWNRDYYQYYFLLINKSLNIQKPNQVK